VEERQAGNRRCDAVVENLGAQVLLGRRGQDEGAIQIAHENKEPGARQRDDGISMEVAGVLEPSEPSPDGRAASAAVGGSGG
jgi:hypothetical protein